MDALTTASHKLAEAIYRQTTQKGKAEEAAPGAGSKEKSLTPSMKTPVADGELKARQTLKSVTL